MWSESCSSHLLKDAASELGKLCRPTSELGKLCRPTSRFHETTKAPGAQAHSHGPATAGAFCCNLPALALPSLHGSLPCIVRCHALQKAKRANNVGAFQGRCWKSRHSSWTGAARMDEERMVLAQRMCTRRCPQDMQRWLTSSMCWAKHPTSPQVTRLLGAGGRKAGPHTLEPTSAALAHQQEPLLWGLLFDYHKAAHACSRAGPGSMWAAQPSAARAVPMHPSNTSCTKSHRSETRLLPASQACRGYAALLATARGASKPSAPSAWRRLPNSRGALVATMVLLAYADGSPVFAYASCARPSGKQCQLKVILK